MMARVSPQPMAILLIMLAVSMSVGFDFRTMFSSPGESVRVCRNEGGTECCVCVHVNVVFVHVEARVHAIHSFVEGIKLSIQSSLISIMISWL